jgi:mono/diheme cytochrome c family protein
MLKRIVGVVQVAAAAAFVVMAVLLITKQPTKHLTELPPPTSLPAGQSAPSGAANGAQLFATNCAGCHGRDGGGGIGPQLRDGAVLDSFSDAGSEVSFVQRGGGGMPSFSNRLSEADIEAIVEFTRTTLQGK